MSATGEFLRVDGLVRVFGTGRMEVRAVDGVDFVSGAGEVTLIMGPSGSGKTTLLSMIGGLLRPTAGRVVIDGVDLWSLDRRRLLEARRGRVGFIFQAFNLLDSLTALENVEIALNVAGVTGAAARERARSLLVKAGLGERLDFWARDLSGGERQRVAIARALANHPRLLLADEPTGSLDSRQGGEVMELLRDLAHQDGNGTVIVSHDLRLRSIADRVLWMQDGRLEGPPALDVPASQSGRA
jgi:putative ABC transport system ATP-binding protein